MSRRQLFGLGLAATAAVSLEGCSSQSAATAARTRRALPRLASRKTPAAGVIRHFRSRPELAPAAVQVDIAKPGQDRGLIFMDSQGGAGDQGPMIIDGAGELVWFEKVSNAKSTTRAFNVQVQQWRGKPVLTWYDGAVVHDHGVGEDVIMDTSYREIARVQAGHGYTDDLHVFNLTPEGTALISAYGLAHGDLPRFGGTKNDPYVYGVAQEIDIASGKVVRQWRSDEHVGLDESYVSAAHQRAWDYFHINSVDVLHDGNLLISGRNTWGVYKVDRKTGKVLWRLGGKKSDFAIGKGAHFAWQHDVNQQHDGSITVFDNGAGAYRSEPQSRALVLDVNEHDHRATLRHAYLHPRTHLQAGTLGSVQFLPNGHVFVGWGIEAAFTEFTTAGEALLDGRLAGPIPQSYRAFRLPWTGTPTEPPAVAVDRQGTGMAVSVSWNGDTRTRDWLLLGGDHPSDLSPLGTAPRRGFETVIDVPHRPAHLAVAALTPNGTEIGRSHVVAA